MARVVDNIAWVCLVVPHLPFLWLMCVPGSPYYKVVAVQAIAGAATEIASIYFSVVSGQTAAIVSAGIGMFSLFISTIVAVQRGFQAAMERRNEGPYRPRSLADCLPIFSMDDDDEEEGGIRDSPCAMGFLATFIACVVLVAFTGVFFFESGYTVVGNILMAAGFGIWLWLLFSYAASSNGQNFDRAWQLFLWSASLVAFVLAIYYLITAGMSRVVIALFCTCGAIAAFLLFCAALVR